MSSPAPGSAETDRKVLLKLYNTTGGESWWRKDGWAENATDLGSWYGVTTNAEGRVVKLELHEKPDDGGNELVGTIPPELGQLGALEVLNLSYNKLFGAIPPELGQLRALKELALSGLPFGQGELSGVIPKELGNLIVLQELNLSNNKLQGAIPKELGRLLALNYLGLAGNRLEGAIPKELGNLAALRQMYMSRNKLKGAIPKEFGNLTALQLLAMYGNELDGAIPREMGNLIALQRLDLYKNRLEGAIPKELGNLCALQRLELYNNRLEGFLPWQLGKLGRLTTCILENNKLCGLWDYQEHESERATLSPGANAGFSKGPLPSELNAVLGVLEGCTDTWGKALGGNPWQHPPLAVVNAGASAVRNYFTAAFAEGASIVQRPLKVVLIGKETVGKTSLRQSIAKGEACRTQNIVEESTVHIDVEDVTILGENVRVFDCAGQEAYYASLQLFLTVHALYLLVVDMAIAVANVEQKLDNLLRELGVLPWVRSLTYRVPKAAVITVGTKCDLVKGTPSQSSSDRLELAAAALQTEICRRSSTWAKHVSERKENGVHSSNKPPPEICLEKGMSLVSFEGSTGLPPVGDGKGWPCDVNEPGLLGRILRDPSKTKRAVSMLLPLGWQRAMECLEEHATLCRKQEGFRGVRQDTLRDEWRRRESERRKSVGPSGHGINLDSSEGAMDGALLLRGSEGGLVVYGSFVFFDVDWLAQVLKPLFSHKPLGRALGGNVARASLTRFEKDGILEPELADELWGKVTAPHVLETLESAGLTFPRPGDKRNGLVVLLRQPSKRPIHVGHRINGFRELKENQENNGQIKAVCTFWEGVPPGFIERLLTQCCRLGASDLFWRFGVLIQSGELFSVILEYDEDEDTLVGKLCVEVFGDCSTADPWAAISACLSVVMHMLSEFPGMDVDAEVDCQNDQHTEESGIPIELSQPLDWSSLIRDVDGCRSCLDHANNEARLRLLYVPVTDVRFDIEKFRLEYSKGIHSTPAERNGMEQAATEAEVHRLNEGAPRQQLMDEAEEDEKCWLDVQRTLGGLSAGVFFPTFVAFAVVENHNSLLWGGFLGLSVVCGLVSIGMFFVAMRSRRRERRRQHAPSLPV